ncbi:hypothetical protein EDB89DRAFT_304477 [Lactarius sanguifluus]|nr:hypothetical protein EDB89DRAFT_304477 [Lactarius sanguifluus]
MGPSWLGGFPWPGPGASSSSWLDTVTGTITNYFGRSNLDEVEIGSWSFDAGANNYTVTTDPVTMSMPSGPSLVDTSSGLACQACGQRFGRPQELKRHEHEVHSPPRHCPFCSYQWRRPDKIKAHLVEAHRDVFSAEILDQIRTLRGNNVVKFVETIEFVNTFEPPRYSMTPQAGGSSTPLFPAPTEET